MIRVIAVDDEQPALRRVGQLLEGRADVQVAGLFAGSVPFLDYVLASPDTVDLALLDIEMPELSGVELARRLRDISPDIHVAFLTAYEEYARDAIDVEALDYLLKPITEADLDRTLKRAGKRMQGRRADSASPERPSLAVRSFGPFSVTTEKGERVRFRNSKGRELLAHLHHARGRTLSKSQILDSLWYGQDVERTQVNLHTTVYQLRKDLEACGLEGAIGLAKTSGGSYCLQWPEAIEDDVVLYEQACREYKETRSLPPLVRAIGLYGEGFLAGSGYDWAAPRQTELELGFATLLEALADVYVSQSRYEIALNPMQRLVQLQPLDERLHAKMVALLLLAGREGEARKYSKLVIDLIDDSEQSALLDFARLSANPFSLFR
ncbi:response regulator [Paenibacillus sp. PAMC21692]|uniref:response regulator n=1 Tax=Paenibacillus sp. PAMC21692 TaxID=2762320 RepID=UPI00164DB2C7|nr:response regulator [Paenibacillus sp. PAMC21692]QNK56115.1 response regulator [Paenibacillus sp. PAMC21692]